MRTKKKEKLFSSSYEFEQDEKREGIFLTFNANKISKFIDRAYHIQTKK